MDPRGQQIESSNQASKREESYPAKTSETAQVRVTLASAACTLQGDHVCRGPQSPFLPTTRIPQSPANPPWMLRYRLHIIPYGWL